MPASSRVARRMCESSDLFIGLIPRTVAGQRRARRLHPRPLPAQRRAPEAHRVLPISEDKYTSLQFPTRPGFQANAIEQHTGIERGRSLPARADADFPERGSRPGEPDEQRAGDCQSRSNRPTSVPVPQLGWSCNGSARARRPLDVQIATEPSIQFWPRFGGKRFVRPRNRWLATPNSLGTNNSRAEASASVP